MNKNIFKEFNIVSKLFFAFWLGVFFIVFFFGESFLPEKYFRDSEILMAMSANGIEELNSGSYYYTTLIFNLIGVKWLSLFTFITGVLYLFMTSMNCKSISSAIIASVLILPHVLLGMSRPQKEVLVSVLVVTLLYFYRKKLSKDFFIFIIISYLIYGIVRNYYYLIIFTFLFLYTIKFNLPKGFKPFILLSAIFVIALLPNSIYETLQGTRDIFNSLRDTGVGNETIYFNPFEPINFFYFILNYLHAFFYFNFPLIFSINLNTIYLQAYMLLVFYLIIKTKHSLFRLLFISHILILLLFEPDLGSYLRHLSSVSLYLAPLLLAISNERLIKPL